jgi:hypothetical protein
MFSFLRFIDKRRFQRHRAVLWAELRSGKLVLRGKLVDISRAGFLFRPWDVNCPPLREATLEAGGQSLRCQLLPKTRLGLHGSFARLLTQRDLEDILRSVRRSAAEAADDPYALLGVPRNASPEAIKAAYRAQVKRIHPDLQAAHADAAHLTRLNQRLARLNAAYQAVRPKP